MPDPDKQLAARQAAASSRAGGGAAGSAVTPYLRSPARTATPAPYRPPVTSTSTGQYTRPAPAPSAPPAQTQGAIPDINAFLGSDTGYQDQLRQFAQALSDMGADVTRKRGSLESNYGLSTKAMGDQRTKDLSNMEADYGARGLLRSGLYAKAQGDYQTEFDQRAAEMARQQNDALGQLDQGLNQYQSQQSLQQQAAREAAIRRRAEQYGV